MRLNREMKAYCRDFGPVRLVLQEIGATFSGEKEQVDYFFVLSEDDRSARRRRLKLRTDDGRPRLIYYYHREEPNARNVEFQIAEVGDPAMKELLAAALGVKTIVRKRREIWKKDNATFNLDEVDGVGRIFEIEVEDSAGDGSNMQLSDYRRLFVPYLGAEIEGSNEDLVGGR